MCENVDCREQQYERPNSVIGECRCQCAHDGRQTEQGHHDDQNIYNLSQGSAHYTSIHYTHRERESKERKKEGTVCIISQTSGS